jgi:hypothetical protein
MAYHHIFCAVSAIVLLRLASQLDAHTTRSSTASMNACRSLAQSLGSKVQFNGTQYTASVKGAWNVFNQLDGDWVQKFFAQPDYSIACPFC